MCLCPDGSSAGPGQPCLVTGECTKDSECPRDKACLGYRCRDPCPGACGINAHCRVEQHHPVCSCPADLGGNPIVRCYPLIGNQLNPIFVEFLILIFFFLILCNLSLFLQVLMKKEIHAFRVLVVQILSVQLTMANQYVRACQIILEILRRDVELNAV